MPGLLYQMICLTNLPHSSIKLFDVANSSPSRPPFSPLQTGFKGQSHNVLLGFVCLFFFFIVLYNYDDVIPNLFMKNVMLKDFENLFSYHIADMS